MANPFAHLLKLQAEYVMRGRREAALMAVLWTVVPLMAWLGAAIMALVTLRKGSKEGFIILLWTALPNAIFAVFNPTARFAFLVGIMGGNLIIWLLAVILRQTGSWRQVLQITGLIGIAVIVIIHSIVPDIAGYWYHMYSNYMKEAHKVWVSGTNTNWQYMIQQMAKLTTGICLVVLLFINLANLLVGRWMQDALYNPGGLSKELLQVRLGPGYDFLLIFIIVAIALGFDLVWDILPVVLFIFFLAGLSLFHAVFAKMKINWAWTVFFYAALILFYGFAPWVVMSAALVDTWFNVRERIKDKTER